MGVKSDKSLASRKDCGIYTFRVNGQIHHLLGDLGSSSSSDIGLQLYFYDPDHELQHRLAATPSLNESVMVNLMRAMEQNPYATFLRSLNKVVDLDRYYISINCSSELDKRMHNRPTSSEIAAIWIDGDDRSETQKFQRDIRVYTKSNEVFSVKEHYSCYDTLQYPLMFPQGEPGWHPNIPKAAKSKNQRMSSSQSSVNDNMEDTSAQYFNEAIDPGESGSKVTARQYYCYKFQMRPGDHSYQLSFGRLLQQYVVDMYVKIETMRLMYIRTHQAKFRVDFYQGVVDSISMGFSEGRNIGKRILLPASFIGRPRDMRKRYIDAMALVRRYGKPDIFLTMTCNANWPEIRNCIENFEEAQNRPDLMARVFRAKLEIMKKRILIDKVFGEVASLVYVVEFQKRGLPHAHFLIILKQVSKLLTPEAYDRVVCAELPNIVDDPDLHAIVTKHMFHGPCGSLNPKCVCMKNGTCRNRYPKPFCEHTVHGKQTYPEYRRRDSGEINAVKVRGHMLDNRWIVPYNPRLIKEFNCHMNVEVCCDIRAVKYLYKYVYKGIDKVSMKVVSENDDTVHDEISMFQSARWVAPSEAIWRIYGFILSHIQLAVLTLQVHLPDFQAVRFSEEDDLENIVAANRTSRTMLTEFFHMNSTNEAAKMLCCLYKDFPERFVWNSSSKRWSQRKRGEVIGRLASVNPSEGERYYLRLLLSNVKTPKSFDDLLYVDGIKSSCFREAANLRGLLTNDATFENALEEAASYHLPYSLRVLFATLLNYCELSDPVHLYRKFYEHLCEDFRNTAHLGFLDEDKIEKMVLQDLDKTLETLGKSINDFKLGNIHISRNIWERLTREVEAELNVPIPPEDLAAVGLLNEKQKDIYDSIMNDVDSENSGIYFIDGPGGTGKTFLYKALLDNIRAHRYIAIATASSGIASTLLPGGRTAHSRFRIPIDGDDSMDTRISKSSSTGRLLVESKLIIWDEAPMVNRSAIEGLNDTLKDLCESEEIFGGKLMIFGGDFRQTLPVVKHGSRADTIEACLAKSPLWKHFKVCKLTENMRAKADPIFAEFLMRIGCGTEPESEFGKVQIPVSMIIPYTSEEESLQALINEVYPSMSSFSTNAESTCSRALLAPKNEAVDTINEALIMKFPGELKTYKSIDRALSIYNESHYSDFLDSQLPSGMPRHELRLKLNCPVVLLRNINPLVGFANGTRLICKSLSEHVIGVEIVSGQFKGSHGFIPRISHKTRKGEKHIIPFTRRQFPLRLAFAMTINKAQGQTLDFVGIYLRQPVFSHGQLYVALSRAITGKNVKILIGPPTESESANNFTRNEVFREVLQLTAT